MDDRRAAAVLEPRPEGQGFVELSARRKLTLLLGPALFAAVVLVPTPPSAAAAAAAVGADALAPQIALGTLLWMLVWWVGEALPLGLATLVVPLVFGLTGILPWKSSLASYADPILWIFMAGFVLAAAFRKWGLNQRVSLALTLAYKGKDPRVAALFVACLPVFFLTLTGSITASTSIVLPFVSAYLVQLKLKPGSRYATGTMLALGQAASAGAMLLLISTAPNLIAKATVQNYAPGESLTFADWLIVGTPMAFAGLAISWFVTFRIIRPEMKELELDRAEMEKVRRGLGPMSRGEWTVLALLLLAVALWTLPSVIRVLAEADPGLGPLAKELADHLPEAMPAVLVILLAGLLRVEREPVLRWPEIASGIDWNIIFLFGGGIALGLGLETSGFARWLASGVVPLLGASPSAFSIFALCALIGFGLTYAASNTAAALVACPLAATLAIGAGVNPLPPILAAALAASISTALPSTTPPMAIVHSTGHVRVVDMMRVGIVADLLRLVVLIAAGPFLTQLIV
jgi:sodium-dependent dicarboxylate transporter 2/3/5